MSAAVASSCAVVELVPQPADSLKNWKEKFPQPGLVHGTHTWFWYGCSVTAASAPITPGAVSTARSYCRYALPPLPVCFTSKLELERPTSCSPEALGEAAMPAAVRFTSAMDRFTAYS